MENSRALWFKQSWLYLKRIFILNLVFLFAGFLWRFAFYKTFGDARELANLGADVLHAFVLGARFDSTVLFYINAVPLLLFLLLSVLTFIKPLEPMLNRAFSRMAGFLVPYYAFMLFVMTFISMVDFGFYSFYQDRINVLIFGYFEDDTWALTKLFFRNYHAHWLILGLALFAWLLWKGVKLNFTQGKEWISLSVKKVSYPTFVFFFFFLFFMNGVGARGTLALFPLSEMDTGISKSLFVNHLCFNGVRALGRAAELKAQQQSHWDSNLRLFGYGENYRQAFADYYQVPETQVPENPLDLLKSRTAKNEWAEKTKPHVLLIVMESFGAYWLQYDQPEFDLVGDLKTHFKQDTYITNFLSSTAATIGSLSCLMISAPQRPISEFLTESDYLQVPFRSSIARTYKEAGYKARFLYGGNPGWREINKFAHAQGFDTTEGEADIASHFNGKLEKHDWGIYDQDFFKYIEETLADAQQPELLLAMTTTNHPPYQLPAGYKTPDLKAPQELRDRLTGDKTLAEKRFQTYRYSTQKLAEFLTRVKNSPLKDKLVIAVTGDHTFWIVNFTEQQALQKGSVPFYLYMPAAIQKKFSADMFGSHADIAPTLYNLTLSEKDYYSTGQDLLATKSGYALNAGNVILNNQGGVLMSGSPENDSFIDWEGHYERLIPGQPTEEKKQLSKKYKSLMGVLDYYFMKEKKENHPHADSSR